MQSIDISRLRGTIVAIPCLNVPGYTNFKREFKDGKDLNRLFPGNLEGTSSQVYAYSIMEKIVNNFNYLIDLHTASFGRVNSYYVRADMNDPVTATLARLQGPQIVLHNSGQDGTLRSAASQKGIKSITVEIGNPQQFQTEFIQWSYVGLMRILKYLEMYPRLNDTSLEPQPNPSVLCSKGFWTYTRTGGVLEVYPEVNTFVKKGLLVACIRDIFGNIVDEYFAPCDSIVIGCSSNPVASTGDRIIHFGVPLRKGEQLPAVAKENY
jgi:predicted deacylase